MCKRTLYLFCLLPCCLRGGGAADDASSKQSDKQSEKEIEIAGQLVASDVPDKERRHPCRSTPSHSTRTRPTPLI